MSPLTLTIATVGGILAFFLKPIQALCVYVAILLWNAQELNIPLGTIDFSSGRLVVLAVLFNLLLKNARYISRFRPNALDFMVIIYFLTQVISFLVTEPTLFVFENRAGNFVDCILPYFLVRFIVVSTSDLKKLLLCVILTSIPLSLFGIFESFTGTNLIGPYIPKGENMRHGLYRAQATFDVHIGFGLFFSLLPPLCLSFVGQKKWRLWWVLLLCAFPLLGMISSMSSAPLFAFNFSTALLALFPFRKYWLLIVLSVTGALFALRFSTGIPIYELLTLFAFSGQTAQYRIELYKEAFGGGMTNHWMFGWGDVNVYSSPDRFPWQYRDLVSIYINCLAKFGLLAFVPLLICNLLYYMRLRRAFVLAPTVREKWLIWCIFCSLVGWNIAMLTVAPVSQTGTLLFMMISVCNSAPALMVTERAIRGLRQREIRVVQQPVVGLAPGPSHAGAG